MSGYLSLQPANSADTQAANRGTDPSQKYTNASNNAGGQPLRINDSPKYTPPTIQSLSSSIRGEHPQKIYSIGVDYTGEQYQQPMLNKDDNNSSVPLRIPPTVSNKQDDGFFDILEISKQTEQVPDHSYRLSLENETHQEKIQDSVFSLIRTSPYPKTISKT